MATIAKDSRLILSRELRHSILKLTAGRKIEPAAPAEDQAAPPKPQDDDRKHP
jgi:hypothetical protein